MGPDRLAQAYEDYAGPMYRFLCGFLGSPEDAKDVLQTVFTRLAGKGLDHVGDLRTYLWTAARNEARTLRRRPPTPYLVPRNGHPIEPGDRETVERCLASLPEDQREVVLLHVLEGLTFEEIALTLGISPDTAASRFRYARQKLQETL
jgi:RNA polymerase sigma-70 factor (ECF subfamily)